MASLVNGGFVATWEDSSAGTTDIRGRVFSANGTANGVDFLISTTTSGTQDSQDVIRLSNGGFAVTWVDYSANAGDIRGRVFNADGTAVNGSDFLVSTTNTNKQYTPQALSLSNGDFAVTWRDTSSGNSDVRARIFHADGTAVTANDFLISTSNTNDQAYPQLTSLTNGDFAVTWRDASSGNQDIRARVFHVDGTAVNTNDFLVSTSNAGNQDSVQITSLTGGGFALTWRDYSSGNSNIRGRVFDNSGTAINAADFLVSTTNTAYQELPQIVSLNNGGFAIAWTDYTSGNSDVVGRVFNADGTSVNGSSFLISNTNTSNQTNLQLTSLANGGFAVSWTDESSGNSDIRSRVFDNNGNAIVSGTIGDDLFTSTNYNSSSQILAGAGGNDVYSFTVTFGNDIINDTSGMHDTIDLTAFIFNASADPFSRLEGGAAGDDLLISLGSQGSITIQNYFNEAGNAAGTGCIESIDFGNHHGITISDLLANAWI